MTKNSIEYRSNTKQDQKDSGIRIDRMSDYLRRYIDSLIREYKDNSNQFYSIDSTTLPLSEKQNLVDLLYLHDPVVNEAIESRIAEILEERLPWVETEDMYEKGFFPRHDSQTGEVNWVK